MITKYRKFKRTSKIPSSLRTIVFLISGVLILIIIGHLIISNFKMNQKRAEFNSRVDSLKQEISALEEKNKELKAQISWISEQEYLEKEARERLNLKKPGEEVVAIVPQEQENKQSLEAVESKSWWEKILEKLGF